MRSDSRWFRLFLAFQTWSCIDSGYRLRCNHVQSESIFWVWLPVSSRFAVSFRFVSCFPNTQLYLWFLSLYRWDESCVFRVPQRSGRLWLHQCQPHRRMCNVTVLLITSARHSRCHILKEWCNYSTYSHGLHCGVQNLWLFFGGVAVKCHWIVTIRMALLLVSPSCELFSSALWVTVSFCGSSLELWDAVDTVRNAHSVSPKTRGMATANELKGCCLPLACRSLVAAAHESL